MTEQYRYLIGVSGGPDSMALLDMTIRKGHYVEVAHVNYHKRDTAKRDQDTVFSYCKDHNIRFYLLDCDPKKCTGNFQAYAREQRYDFFKKICEERKLDAVLIAHHKDDLIETYLMQKDKKIGVSYYGLRKNNIINGVKVIRPLLSKTKKQLEKYCIDNNISFGIDESNNTDDYERNRIRHTVIDKMSLKDKNQLVSLIKLKNREIEKQLKEASRYLKKEVYEVDEFLNTPYLKRYLRQFFNHMSSDHADEMLRQLKESDECCFESEKIVVVKEYGKIEFYKRIHPYEYTFETIEELLNFRCRYFKTGSKGKPVNGVYVDSSDFPVTVRTFKNGDLIRMRFGSKKVNRFFIDKKMMQKDRQKWPLVFNRDNELILVPGLGCSVDHYQVTYNIFLNLL